MISLNYQGIVSMGALLSGVVIWDFTAIDPIRAKEMTTCFPFDSRGRVPLGLPTPAG